MTKNFTNDYLHDKFIFYTTNYNFTNQKVLHDKKSHMFLFT